MGQTALLPKVSACRNSITVACDPFPQFHSFIYIMNGHRWVRAIKWTIGPVGVLLGIKCVGREKLVKRLRPSFQCE